MSIHKIFQFEGEMTKNIDFYILDHSSSENNDLIKSKIGQYKNIPEFFSYYSDKNITSLFELLDIVDKNYSDLYNQNTHIKFDMKIDKYISDLSNIILLYNLISKNQQILSNALIHTESYLNNFYLENKINIESQKKMNNYIDNLINSKKKKKKRFSTILNTDNLFNKSHRHKPIKSNKPSLFVINRKTEEKNITINNNLFHNIKISANNLINEERNINDLTTPKFPRKSIVEENNIKDLEQSTKNGIFKQESIQSYYTLASKSPFIVNSSENVNTPKIKKVNFREGKNNNLNLNNIEDEDEAKLVYSKTNANEENNTSNSPNSIEKKIPKQTFSSINLKSTIEKKMMKDFLGFINNLYKNKVINNEEKLKLKQLIIGRSAKIENIYNIYYENNKDVFIHELKNIIKNNI